MHDFLLKEPISATVFKMTTYGESRAYYKTWYDFPPQMLTQNTSTTKGM